MPKIHSPIAQVRRHFFAGMQTTLAAVALCILSGCASFTPITSQEDDTYHLALTGLSYTMSMPALTAMSNEKARAWCAALNKDMQLRQQIRSWQPMQVELNFRCVARKEIAQDTTPKQ